MPTHSSSLPDENARRRLDILVVDDIATNRKLLRATLELEKAEAIGAVAFLEKPFENDQLISAVRAAASN